MSIKTWLTTILVGLALASCTSLQDLTSRKATEAAERRAPRVAQIETEAPDIQALDQNNIPAGKCGMLLWTLEAGNPVMIFRAVQNEGAEMIIENVPTQLTLVRQAGESRYGIASEQEYQTIATGAEFVTAGINTTFGLSFEGGVYVEKGSITLANELGWEHILPVAGLAGCRS